jgi:threonine dehydratase
MVTLDQIKQAQNLLRVIAVRTPLIRYFSGGDEHLFLKPESLQPIGSFKVRGAYNKISSLTDEQRRLGVITYSSGNHGQGVAYAARAVGAKAVVVMPQNAPRIKVDAILGLGAEVLFVGAGSTERMKRAEALAAEHGYSIVPPYADEYVIAGQGTVGLEILEDMADVDLVLAPTGGGGLLGGIATAIKLSGSKAKVIGVEPELANDAQQTLRRGEIVTLPAEQVSQTLADGLRTQSIGAPNFEQIRRYVDDIITVSEDEIRSAVRRMVREARIIAEPSGAVTFAAWLYHRDELPQSKNTVAVVSGGNIEPHLLAQILNETPSVSS